MRLKAFAVIDTNVIISAMATNNKSAVHDIMNYVENNNIIPVFDERMLFEYNHVMNYDQFNFTEQEKYDTLFKIVDNGILVNDVKMAKEHFKDRKDIPFFEVKESTKDLNSYLVTGNISDFPTETDNIVTPREMLLTMKANDELLSFIENNYSHDTDYETSVQNYINEKLSSGKYISGKELMSDLFNVSEKKINYKSRALQLGAIAFEKTANGDINKSDDFTK